MRDCFVNKLLQSILGVGPDFALWFPFCPPSVRPCSGNIKPAVYSQLLQRLPNSKHHWTNRRVRNRLTYFVDIVQFLFCNTVYQHKGNYRPDYKLATTPGREEQGNLFTLRATVPSEQPFEGHMPAVGRAKGESGRSNSCKSNLCTGGLFLHILWHTPLYPPFRQSTGIIWVQGWIPARQKYLQSILGQWEVCPWGRQFWGAVREACWRSAFCPWNCGFLPLK